MQQTVVVAVERRTRHPLYERVIRSTKKYHAHNAGDQAQAGQRVRIQETRPLSKLKRWEVVAVLGE
ncbi:MAG: 30S ribosomal protein S17 [Fimbriimonadaceae bacterium]|nr:30S ribosomal protein S17 [Fimbriimonadaceae bacterium]